MSGAQLQLISRNKILNRSPGFILRFMLDNCGQTALYTMTCMVRNLQKGRINFWMTIAMCTYTILALVSIETKYEYTLTAAADELISPKSNDYNDLLYFCLRSYAGEQAAIQETLVLCRPSLYITYMSCYEVHLGISRVEHLMNFVPETLRSPLFSESCLCQFLHCRAENFKDFPFQTAWLVALQIGQQVSGVYKTRQFACLMDEGC